MSLIIRKERGTSPVVQWFRLRAPSKGAHIPSLLKEPRSQKPCSMAGKKEKTKKRRNNRRKKKGKKKKDTKEM